MHEKTAFGHRDDDGHGTVSAPCHSNNIQNNYYVIFGTSIAQVQTVFKGTLLFCFCEI